MFRDDLVPRPPAPTWAITRLIPYMALSVAALSCAAGLASADSSHLGSQAGAQQHPDTSFTGLGIEEYCPSLGGDVGTETFHDVSVSREGGSIRIRANVWILKPEYCFGPPPPACLFGSGHEWVDAWIDWNGNKVWEPQEHVLDQASLVSGEGIIPFEVVVPIPPNAAAETWLRAVLRYGVDDNDPCLQLWGRGAKRDKLVRVGNVAVTSIAATGTETTIIDVSDPVWTGTFGPPPAYEITGGPPKPVAGGFNTTGPTLHVQLTGAPAAPSYSPQVNYKWQIPADGTPVRSGAGSFTAMEGDVQLDLPGVVTETDVNLTFDILNPQGDYIQRGQTVTLPVLVGVAPSKLPTVDEAVLRKAVEFANGQRTPEEVSTSVMQRIYNSGWQYYDVKSTWDELLFGVQTAGNCATVSTMWEALTSALGLATTTRQTKDEGIPHFLTVTNSRTFDGRYGNAAPLSSAYDRWFFGMHQVGTLQIDGGSQPYFDPTYNRRYMALQDVVAARWPGVPFRFNLLRSFDGASTFDIIKRDPAFWVAGGWEGWTYQPAAAGPRVDLSPSQATAVTDVPVIEGPYVWSTIDGDGDGQYETLRLGGFISSPGLENLSWSGVLTMPTGDVVSIRESGLSSGLAGGALLAPGPGSHPFHIDFSGEDIRTKAVAGPYDCTLWPYAGGVPGTPVTVSSPAYAASAFGESPVEITALASAPFDTDANSLYNVLAVDVTILGHAATSGAVTVGLSGDGGTVLVGKRSVPVSLATGVGTVRVDIDGRDIRRAGLGGQLAIGARVEVSGRPDVERAGLTPSLNPNEFEPVPVLWDRVDEDSLEGPVGGPYSALLVLAPIGVSAPGNYTWAAILRSQGIDVAVASGKGVLSVGAQTIVLRFEGSEIYAHGLDGPYTLAKLRMVSEDGYVSTGTAPFYSGGYAASDFTPPAPSDPLVTIYSVSFGAPIDTSGNGRFDELPVQVDVEAAVAGAVTISGSLYSPSGAFVQSTSPTTTMAVSERRVINLMYSGRLIYAQGELGLCTVRSIRASSAVDPLRDARFPTTTQTSAVSPDLFEPAPAVVGSVRFSTGIGIAGAAVVAQPAGTAAYSGTSGSYALHIPGAGGGQQTVILQPTEVAGYPDEWQAYVDGSYIGQTRSVQVAPALGQRISVWFVNGLPYVGVGDPGVVASPLSLAVSPNPILAGRPATFSASWRGTGTPTLCMFDLKGRLVRQLQIEPVGTEAVLEWDGLDDTGGPLPAGVYFLRLWLGKQSSVQRIVVLR